MNLGTQIKKHRTALALSQEQLADKIFVTRQSVSNWENNKTYPDIKSLLLLSELFGISVDELIKGDVTMMKKEISEQEKSQFQKDSTVFTVLTILMILLPVPLIMLLDWVGTALWAVLVGAAFYYGVRVDRHKKKHNIQTYKEILAFTEGRTLTDIEQAREEGKRPYQKILIVVGFAAASVAVVFCMDLLFRLV